MSGLQSLSGISSSDSSSTSSSDSSTSDDEFLAILNTYQQIPHAPKPKKFSKREDMYLKYDDSEFEYRFRLTKLAADQLIEKLSNKLEFLDQRNRPLSPKEQVLIALRYYATASFQIVAGDLFGVSQPTICRTVLRVSKAIASLAHYEIRMPQSPEEILDTKVKFFEMYGMPNVVGVIDGTHIPIQSPGGKDAERFRNRKTWFSINVQVVCDADMRITDINARWPGSCHDQMVFNFSKLRARLEASEFGSSYLLGDSGYGCRNYLLTPISGPKTPAENAYNLAFVQTRQIVERTIGVWKRRFPVIGIKNRLKSTTATIVIVATAVLHNLLRDIEPPPPEVSTEILIQPETRNESENTNRSDFSVRNSLVKNIFDAN